MIVPRLVMADLRRHKVRAGLTCAAIALSVALVVAMTSGFTSMRGAARRFMVSHYGTVDVVVKASADAHDEIDARIVDQLKADPDTAEAVGRIRALMPLLDSRGRREGHTVKVEGIRPPGEGEGGVRMVLNQGRWFRPGEVNVAVVDHPIAEELGIEAGDWIMLPTPSGPRRMEVLGLAAKPSILNFRSPTVYVPLDTLGAIMQNSNVVGEIEVDLKPGADKAAFVARWDAALNRNGPTVQFRTIETEHAAFDRNLQGLSLLSYLGGAVSMGAAVFIVFSALSMGVMERTRTLAMLRAVGALKRQVAMLVVVEAAMLAAIGSAAGVAIGYAAMQWVAGRYDEMFLEGAVMSRGGIVFGTAGLFAASLAASLLPAWSATRVDPLEAMAPLGRSQPRRVPAICAVAGLLLIAVDPLIVFMPGLGSAVRLYTHIVLGVPSLFVGLFLLGPMLVLIVERVVGRVAAIVLRLDAGLLRQQLSHGLWRSAGTAAALMVGLAALTVMQTHGHTMLSGWQLPNRFPDMLIFAPMGLNEFQQRQLASVRGIKPDELLPVALVSPEFGGELSVFHVGGLLNMPDATLFFGLDTDKAFGFTASDNGNDHRDHAGEAGTAPGMVELEFIAGDPASAAAMLRKGRHVLISDEFNRIQGLTVGDRLPLKTKLNGEQQYTVAGVVRSMGVDVLVRIFDIGREFERWTAGSLIGTMQDAQRDFGVDRVMLFAANVDVEGDKREVERRIREQLATRGLLSADARRIKSKIDDFFTDVLDLSSTVAFLAMAIASLGVTNTIMASVRTRQWQFGVLRSIGLTRGALLRVIVAEAVMVGVLACAMGLAAGFILSVDANEMAGVVIGYAPPLTPPWGIILVGVGVTIAAAAAAALWPAIRVAMADTLKLLQGGRASA